MEGSDLFDCPVCLEEMRPPKKIFQCSNGHSFCEQCKKNPALKSCPVCRVAFTGFNVTRNILAETLAGQMSSSSSPQKFDDTKNVLDLDKSFSNLVTSLPEPSVQTRDDSSMISYNRCHSAPLSIKRTTFQHSGSFSSIQTWSQIRQQEHFGQNFKRSISIEQPQNKELREKLQQRSGRNVQ